MEITKSRDIPQNDYYCNLQKEWITYYLRSKLYNTEHERKKFSDICRMKKDKIDSFSLKNSIDSIFSSEEKMDKYLNLFYEKGKLPDFQYAPKTERLKKRDFIAFFSIGTNITYNGTIGVIRYSDFNTKTMTIDCMGAIKSVSHTEIRRVKYKELFDEKNSAKN